MDPLKLMRSNSRTLVLLDYEGAIVSAVARRYNRVFLLRAVRAVPSSSWNTNKKRRDRAHHLEEERMLEILWYEPLDRQGIVVHEGEFSKWKRDR